jgi:multidrug efflux pump
MSVFVPVAFMPGDTGRMFAEFSVTLAIAVAFSGFVALTLSPMMASKILRARRGWLHRAHCSIASLARCSGVIAGCSDKALHFPGSAFPIVAGITALCVWLLMNIPDEFMPREDRGSFFVTATSPPGTTLCQRRADAR